MREDKRQVRRDAALGMAFAAAMLITVIAVTLHQWGLQPPLDPVLWLFVLLFALMLSMLVAGILMLRTNGDRAQCVFGVPWRCSGAW